MTAQRSAFIEHLILGFAVTAFVILLASWAVTGERPSTGGVVALLLLFLASGGMRMQRAKVAGVPEGGSNAR